MDIPHVYLFTSWTFASPVFVDSIYVEAYIYIFLLGKYLGVGQQDCMISICLTV